MKKNLRKTPSAVSAKIKSIKGNLIVVGCAKKFTVQSIRDGILAPLNISLTQKGLVVPIRALPPASLGKFSDRNLNGEIVVRKDLPKKTHYRTVEVPNWGDSYNGTHEVDLPYEMYPREFRPPRGLTIKMECANSARDLNEYVISFQVEEVLDKTSATFEVTLLQNLNLLQESIGACGAQASDVSLSGYLQTLHVSWEVLPPGTKDSALQRLFKGRTPSEQERNVASDRYDFFQGLKAKQLVFGSSGLSRYFGALIADDLVVFENIEYGNAIYILFANWKELSQRSRVDLLSGAFGTDFERIVHREGWKEAVKKVVSNRRHSK